MTLVLASDLFDLNVRLGYIIVNMYLTSDHSFFYSIEILLDNLQI